MKISLIALFSSAILLTSSCSLVKYTVDHAPYTVIKNDSDIELRHYDSMLLISASMGDSSEKNSRRNKEDGSFMRLFDYISGENNLGQDIPMTAPVFMDERKQKAMSFVLPESFSLDNAPLPKHEDLSLQEIQNLTVAVISFNGRLDQKTIVKRKAELVSWMEQNLYQANGEPLIAGYDPPSALPWFRRNEILIPITYPSSKNAQGI